MNEPATEFQEELFKSLVKERRAACERDDEQTVLAKAREIMNLLPNEIFFMNEFVIEEIFMLKKSTLTISTFCTSGKSYWTRCVNKEQFSLERFIWKFNRFLFVHEENPFYGPYFSKESIIDAIHNYQENERIEQKKYDEQFKKQFKK